MQITARAEPRYYIELTKADAEMIRDLAIKNRKHKTACIVAAELAHGWSQYIGLLATEETHWTRMVNATHNQLDKVCKILSSSGPQPVEVMARVNAMRTLFEEAMRASSARCRDFDMSFASVELMNPITRD